MQQCVFAFVCPSNQNACMAYASDLPIIKYPWLMNIDFDYSFIDAACMVQWSCRDKYIRWMNEKL